MNKLNHFLAAALVVIGVGAGGAALAEDQKPQTLKQLLEYVKQGQASDAREAREREARFASDKTQQQAELSRVKAERKAAQGRSEQLEIDFEANELLISQKQAQLLSLIHISEPTRPY